jgi:hypothetical protein
MAWTAADLETIERAIADGGGVRALAFSDQSITFSSLDEMLKLRASIKNELAATSYPPRNIRYVVVDKGA